MAYDKETTCVFHDNDGIPRHVTGSQQDIKALRAVLVKMQMANQALYFIRNETSLYCSIAAEPIRA